MRDVDRERAAVAVASGLDTTRLVAAARRHHMLPLLHRHVSRQAIRLDRDAAQAIGTGSAQIVRRNLHLSAQLLAALAHLDAVGIRAVPLKGPVLAQRAYGSVGMRPFLDLDVLVSQDDLDRAVSVLESAGYHRRLKSRGEQYLERKFRHHVGLFAPGTRTHLEVHSSLIASSTGQVVGLDALCGRTKTLDFLGRQVEVLSDDTLVAYLCQHGGSHAWSRIEWLATAAECARRVEDWDLIHAAAALMRATARLTAGRALFELLLEPESSQPVDRASAIVLAGLADGSGPIPGMSYQLLTDDGWSARLWRLWAQFGRPYPADAAALPLPRRLSGLYYLTRPLRHVAKVLMQVPVRVTRRQLGKIRN